ncbi:hypothetical protein Cs7R123_53780 [Catellatospora sp. TT07R-123]|uniref:hypothetical protein n=1 Tax=Catellatospora sp. TT07R-123 TaxID=2733863 RepID=UPI001B185110|nr:hypothetical protein [Catellatospora sp. TT07R-123]GHJ48036.1 hypothetical protein Cs7R123_53780 [Catellatospora sp. TT07R-123]
MLSPLKSRIDEIERVMRAHDLDAFADGLSELVRQARELSPGELTRVIGELAVLLPDIGGAYARLAVLAGACVEWGGSPLPLVEALPRRAAEALETAEVFRGAWESATRGRALPDRDKDDQDKVLRRLVRKSRRTNLSDEDAVMAVSAWFDVVDWLKCAITVLGRADFRRGMAASDRRRLSAAAEPLAEHLSRAHWVHGLCRVLDDEPLIVLDRLTGRGFRLTMSGVGDNFQLHTLLADRLGGPDGPALPHVGPVEPAWLAAATTGEQKVPSADAVVRRFRLFDGTGEYVYPEGVPADIEPTEGVRVLVLHPPRGRYLWLAGRVYRHMVPVLTLDGELSPEQAAAWFGRIGVARETDLMAAQPA